MLISFYAGMPFFQIENYYHELKISRRHVHCLKEIHMENPKALDHPGDTKPYKLSTTVFGEWRPGLEDFLIANE